MWRNEVKYIQRIRSVRPWTMHRDLEIHRCIPIASALSEASNWPGHINITSSSHQVLSCKENFQICSLWCENLKQTRSNIRRCITLASGFVWPSRAFPREADERRLITLFPEGRNAQGQRFAGVFRLHLYLSERKRERRSLYLAKETETVSHWMLLIRQLPTPCTLSNPYIMIYIYTYIYIHIH